MVAQTRRQKANNKIVMTLAVIGLISILMSACKPGGSSGSSTPSQVVSDSNPNNYSGGTEDIISHCQSKKVFCLGQGVIAMPVKVNIPQGAFVAESFMKFYPYNVQSSYQKDINLLVSVEPWKGQDFSTILADAGAFFDKSQQWSLKKWSSTSTEYIRTPSLAERLTEIVSDSNWQNGSYVTLIFQNITHDFTEGELRLAHFPEENAMNSPELFYSYTPMTDKFKVDLLEKGAEYVVKNYDYIESKASLIGVNSKYLFEQSQALITPKEESSQPAPTTDVNVDDSIVSKPIYNDGTKYDLNLSKFQSWWDNVVSTFGDAVIIEQNLPSTLNLIERTSYKLLVKAYGVNLTYKWYKNGSLVATTSSSSLTIQAPAAGLTDRYYVQVIGSNDYATSNTTSVKGLKESQITSSGTAMLSWTPPLTRENGESLKMAEISGYKIGYYKEGEKIEDAKMISINNASTTEYVFNNLNSGVKYYFFIKTIDTNGLESSNSNPVSKTIL